jgi:hypothetical protein
MKCSGKYFHLRWVKLVGSVGCYIMMNFVVSDNSIVKVVRPVRLQCAGHISRMGETRKANRILVRKCLGKRPPGRARIRWEDNIKMDLREIGCCEGGK